MGSKCPECRETLAESRDYCELCGWHSYQDEDVRDVGQTLDAAVELTTRMNRALVEKDARIAALTEELERVKGVLCGAFVDYDTQPYQMGDEDCERLFRCPKTGLYRLDEQSVQDIAKEPT